MGWTGVVATSYEERMRGHLSDARVIDGPVWTRGQETDPRRECWVLVRARDGHPLIVLCVVDRVKRHDGTWYYIKDVDTTMGPMRHDPPAAWLGIAPDRGGFDGEWRRAVLVKMGLRSTAELGIRA